jgi:hypothetical protein
MCITKVKDVPATIKIKGWVNKFTALRPGIHITQATVDPEDKIKIQWRKQIYLNQYCKKMSHKGRNLSVCVNT